MVNRINTSEENVLVFATYSWNGFLYKISESEAMQKASRFNPRFGGDSRRGFYSETVTERDLHKESAMVNGGF